MSVPGGEGEAGGAERQLLFCQPVTAGEARAQPVQAKNRKQVDFAAAQMRAGRQAAHVWAWRGAWRNGKDSLLRSQAGESRGPRLGFRLLWDEAIN